jgi:molybdopterin converting factor small subunit
MSRQVNRTKIRLRFYGVFRTAAGTNELVIEVAGKNPTVRSVIMQLVAQKEFEGLKQLLLENETGDPRPNALIMVSGREINTLSGLETALTEKDELALLPVAHGG